MAVDENASIDEAGLVSWLQDELNADFNVRLVKVESISASPSGKFEDFLSLVDLHPPSNRKK